MTLVARVIALAQAVAADIKGIQSTLGGLGTAARKNVTTSAIDKTPDRVLRTGDGGWMGDVPLGTINIDDRALRGWRYVTGEATGTRPGGWTYGILNTFGFTSDGVIQEFWPLTGGAGSTYPKYRRQTYGAGAWGPWRSADAEYGSNANGSYTRFPDGLMVCVTPIMSRTVGEPLLQFYWPSTFVTRPTMNVVVIPSSRWEVASGFYSNTDSAVVYFPNTGATENTVICSAIGYWK